MLVKRSLPKRRQLSLSIFHIPSPFVCSSFRLSHSELFQVMQTLVRVSTKVKTIKDNKEALSFFRSEIENLNRKWPKNCPLSLGTSLVFTSLCFWWRRFSFFCHALTPHLLTCLDPSFITKGIRADKCKIMDSKMKPLWLLFEVIFPPYFSPSSSPLPFLVPCGHSLLFRMRIRLVERIATCMWSSSRVMICARTCWHCKCSVSWINYGRRRILIWLSIRMASSQQVVILVWLRSSPLLRQSPRSKRSSQVCSHSRFSSLFTTFFSPWSEDGWFSGCIQRGGSLQMAAASQSWWVVY